MSQSIRQDAALPAVAAMLAHLKAIELQRSALRKLSATLAPRIVRIPEEDVRFFSERMTALLSEIGAHVRRDEEHYGEIHDFTCLDGPYSQEHYDLFWLVMDGISEVFTSCSEEEAAEANETPHLIAWEAKNGDHYVVPLSIYKAAYELSQVIKTYQPAAKAA